MSVVTDYCEFAKQRWLAVYGASIAIQVHSKIREGSWNADPEIMKIIKEEAASIADLEADREAK